MYLIAIDDVSLVKGGSCQALKSTTTQAPTAAVTGKPIYACGFETGFCEWTPETSGKVQWTRRTGRNAVFGQAPFSDVTYGNVLGYYAHVASNSTDFFTKAFLKSPPLTVQSEICLDFYYQIGGPTASYLTVNMATSTNKTELWKRVSADRGSWSHAYVKIPAASQTTGGQRWVEFEGDGSVSLNGFVSVDEVKIILGICPSPKYCDFEKDLCDFVHDVTGDFKWERIKGPTSTGSTGPSFDHTYQVLVLWLFLEI